MEQLRCGFQTVIAGPSGQVARNCLPVFSPQHITAGKQTKAPPNHVCSITRRQIMLKTSNNH